MITFGVSLTVLLIILGMICKKSRLLFAIQCIWLWVLTGLSNGGWDFSENEMLYYVAGKDVFAGVIGWLNNILAYFAHKADWDYVRYNAVLCIVAVMLIAYVVCRHSKRPCFVMSMILIYPMMDSVYQKRFFIAMCFILLAYSFWIEGKTALYFFFVFIGVGFHAAVLIYFLLPVMEWILMKRRKCLAVFFLTAEFLIFRFMDKIMQLPFLRMFYGKFITYTEEQQYSSPIVGVFFLTMQIGYIFIILYIARHWPEKRVFKGSLERRMPSMTITSILFLPLLLIGSTFVRYYRVYQILSYAYIGNRIEHKASGKKFSDWLVIAYIILLIISTYVIFINDSHGLMAALESVYENNVLISFLFDG